MKTLFAILGLFMFASVSTSDVKTTTSKEDVKGYYLTADGSTKGGADNSGNKIVVILV